MKSTAPKACGSPWRDPRPSLHRQGRALGATAQRWMGPAGARRLGSLAAAPSHDGDRNQGQRAADDVGQPVASIHAAAAWGHQLVGLIKEPNRRGQSGQ